MEFKKKILDNGLSIIGELNETAKTAAVGFFVKTGARDESPQLNGVSHFLEHMLFKGTDSLNTFQVNEAFDKTGAQYNAFTSEELTVFYAALLPEYLSQITALWIDLLSPALRDDDFNIEKNVIKEEIAMYKDQPEFEVLDKCKSSHFEQHPLGNRVLGTVESVESLSSQQMKSYFANRYVPNNMSLVVAGNFNWQKIIRLCEERCKLWQSKKTPRITEDLPGSKKTERITKPGIAHEYICLMSRAVSAQDKRRFAAYLLASIIGDHVGSRFFWELVDKALAEEAAMQFGAMDGTGVFQSYFSCNPGNADKVLQIVRNIFEDITRKGVTEEELQKAKNKTASALVIKNEVPFGRLVDVGFNWTYLGQYRTIADDIQAIKAVSADQVSSLARQLNLLDYTQCSIGPP